MGVPEVRLWSECQTCGAMPGEHCMSRGGTILSINQQHSDRLQFFPERGGWCVLYDSRWRELPPSERFKLGGKDRTEVA